jgi:uncharacterized repeat protein (TIGR03837 family)
MLWDIFCKVIDNHGDLGVCWRLSAGLAARGERVRLWVDDPSALGWMAPEGAEGVEVLHWTAAMPLPAPGDILVEAFGCDPPEQFVAMRAAQPGLRERSWINLEYLTAETFAERSHGLPSPVMTGPGKGLVKHFFYPGFTRPTGGLLREPGLEARQAAFDPAAWLATLGIERDGASLVSLFCYEPPLLGALLRQLAAADHPTRLLVTAGRAATAVAANRPASLGALSIVQLPYLSQPDFDHLLWASDFNFVRGEDSLVRALWAGKPFAWQLYPQDDGAHLLKLQAFLACLAAPPPVAELYAAWNGAGTTLPPLDLMAGQAWARQARQRLSGQDDLVSQLLRFAGGAGPGAKKR